MVGAEHARRVYGALLEGVVGCVVVPWTRGNVDDGRDYDACGIWTDRLCEIGYQVALYLPAWHDRAFGDHTRSGPGFARAGMTVCVRVVAWTLAPSYRLTPAQTHMLAHIKRPMNMIESVHQRQV